MRRQLEDHVGGTLGRLPIGEDVVAEVERQIVDERLNMLGSVAVDASASIVAREHVALRGQQSDAETQLLPAGSSARNEGEPGSTRVAAPLISPGS